MSHPSPPDPKLDLPGLPTEVTDLLTSIVRDVTGKVVGAILGLALALGITVPADMSAQLTIVVGGLLALVCQVIYYVAVRAAERRWPAVGRLLGVARPPTYGGFVPIKAKLVIDHDAATADAIRAAQHVQAIVRDAQLRRGQRM